MPATQIENAEIAALNAKLSAARQEIRSKDAELNDLRNRVVQLEAASDEKSLKAENEILKADLADVSARLADCDKQLAKAVRDIAAAGPALELAAAIKSAVKQ